MKLNFPSKYAHWVVAFPKSVVLFSMLLMAVVLSGLPKLYKDTRADAFLANDNPALVYRQKVQEQFGLRDPIVVAVINDSDHGVFNPSSLKLVAWLTEKISSLNNINADRVTSLATENNITGTEDGMLVEPFFNEAPETQQGADRVWQQVSDFPLYMGNLVAKDKKATLIVAELNDEELVEDTYNQVLRLIDNAPESLGDEIHVAGEGGIAGYLGAYIDADAQRLNPLAGLVITIIILLAFARISPAILSNVIIAASVLMTLSIMALSEVAFFVITNAMPVILIGISVADSIHIYSHYFELQAADPRADKKLLIVKTLEEMWRPITLTTFTTVAGFIGLYFAASMPPFKYFGLFTAVGVLVAWIFSLFFLPAAMAIIKPSASKRSVKRAESQELDIFATGMTRFGQLTLAYPRAIVAFFACIVFAGIVAASALVVDENRIATFHPSEALYQADMAINKHFNGTYNLDIVVEANADEGLFELDNLKAMESLQNYALTLENVQGATSIVDYLKQMNRSLNAGNASEYRLPANRDLVAQYLLIYSASSDPTDFEEEIDYDYRMANIRLNLNKGSYQETKDIIDKLQTYINEQINNDGLSATLSGRVTVNYHWIKNLGKSHFIGLGISLFLVWAVAALLFGSMNAGLFSLLPVASAILLVYAAMVLLNINLGIGTSMFASVAIGLGVDFAIHTIERMRSLYAAHQGNWDAALRALYPSTGRALLLNYLAIAMGFGVLISSKVVPLNNFGSIVVVAVTTSFIASLSFLPAFIMLTKPQFISDPYRRVSEVGKVSSTQFARTITTIIILLGVGGFIWSSGAKAQTQLDANTVVRNVNQINDGEHVIRNLTMTLTDRRGKVRVRTTKNFRKYFGQEKRTILFYEKPANVKGTSFLTFDYDDVGKDDDQWLYLPALRKVRRISASDRGDYFLGTDFTYEDIKLEGKLQEQDYDYELVDEQTLTLDSGESYQTVLMRGVPKTGAIAQELGYGRTEFWVDTKTWLVIKAEYWDPKNVHLKTLVNRDIKVVDGIYTRHKLEVNNHKTGHNTVFEFSNVDYQSPVEDHLFSKSAMKRGG